MHIISCINGQQIRRELTPTEERAELAHRDRGIAKAKTRHVANEARRSAQLAGLAKIHQLAGLTQTEIDAQFRTAAEGLGIVRDMPTLRE